MLLRRLTGGVRAVRDIWRWLLEEKFKLLFSALSVACFAPEYYLHSYSLHSVTSSSLAQWRKPSGMRFIFIFDLPSSVSLGQAVFSWQRSGSGLGSTRFGSSTSDEERAVLTAIRFRVFLQYLETSWASFKSRDRLE
jgi:hypothetical protein